MAASRDGVRSTWISLVDFDGEDGPNVGVEISWGVAPPRAVRATRRSGDVELTAPVHRGDYWFVRWRVPDPAANDDDAAELIRFVSE